MTASEMNRPLLLLAAAVGATGVALGAFAAHALRGSLDALRMGTFQTGVLYHLLHAPAIAVAALVGGPRGALAGGLFAGGVTLFSGSLYLIAALGLRRLGVLTPLGGLALIAGWLSLGWATARG